MKKYILFIIMFFIFNYSSFLIIAQVEVTDLHTLSCALYPELNNDKPDLPSPFIGSDGNEYIVAVNKDQKYAIIPVTLRNDRGICRQLIIDTLDFPTLAKS